MPSLSRRWCGWRTGGYLRFPRGTGVAPAYGREGEREGDGFDIEAVKELTLISKDAPELGSSSDSEHSVDLEIKASSQEYHLYVSYMDALSPLIFVFRYGCLEVPGMNVHIIVSYGEEEMWNIILIKGMSR